MKLSLWTKKTVTWCIIFATALCGCGKVNPKKEWTVYMPDGAPALAIASMMHADRVDDGFSYRVVSPALIASKVTWKNESKNADFCALPITAASKLLGDGERYALLGTLTKGNLYLVSQTAGEISDLSALAGQTVGVIQIKEVPGLTLKAVLDKNGVAWKELTQGEQPQADKVNLKGVAGVDGSCAYYLLAEPAVSKMLTKGFSVVGNLQSLYGKNGYPQAVMVVKRSVLETDEAAVSAFWESVQSGVEWLTSVSAETLYQTVTAHFEDKGMMPAFTAQTLSKETVLRCGIAVQNAAECKTEMEAYLSGLEGNFIMPDDKFYYGFVK